MATGPIAYYFLRVGKRRKGIDRVIELEFDEPEVNA